MSLSELLEQLARILPYVLKQSLILRDILCHTREFFGRLSASESSAPPDALKFTMFLIIINSLIFLPVDSLIWRIDPLSPPIFVANVIISSLSVLTLVISLYIALTLVFKPDTLLNCSVLSCYIYAFLIVTTIADYPSKFIAPGEILERSSSALDIDLNQIYLWIQSLSYRDRARFAVVSVLMVAIDIFILAKLTLSLSAYLRISYLRALLAMGLLVAVHSLFLATLVWPIFIGVVRLSR